jgi:hypothetical protein
MRKGLENLFPARYSAPNLRVVVEDERRKRAQRAAILGIRRMPQQPGLWVRTTVDGAQRVYRVRDYNGELYATAGRISPVAVPTAKLPGYWYHLG